MPGLKRFSAVLRLFSEEKSAWTVPAISEALTIPVSTAYRTVKDLLAAGFLETSTGAEYRLGPAFLEFDRLTRLTDPAVQAGRPVLHDVVMQARIPCVGLLSRLYNDTVMCIADEAAGRVEFRTSYERGRPMPLTHGATSRVILAQLPPRRLGKLLARGMPGERGAADVTGNSRDALLDVRRRGYCVSRGEIDQGLVGIAAPLMLPETGLLGSLSLVAEAKSLDDALERRLVLLVVSAASLLTEELRASMGAALARSQDDDARQSKIAS
jgi:DNA-binding IclR family transcriptional regulator